MAQKGWLTKEERKRPGKVWVFHFYKLRAGDGKRVENNCVIGLLASFPKESLAWEEVERQCLNVNEHNLQSGRLTFGDLAGNYEQNALPKLGINTQKIVRGILTNYLIPRWGTTTALQIRALDIELWLGSLTHLSNATRDKLRRVMFRIYFKAQKHGLIPCREENNPVKGVEQSAKSSYKAALISPEQALKILMALPEPVRTLMLLIAATGLRISEALGLKWSDLDYESKQIHLSRKWSQRTVIDTMKTVASEAPATLGPMLAEFLKSWHAETPYGKPDDWIFPSFKLKGTQPRTASIMASDHIRPAAIAAGIQLDPGQRFGFHNLRHSLATFIVNKEMDAKTAQGLLRHANVTTTLALYAQSVNSSMVAAQETMMKAILDSGSNAVN